MKRNFNVNIEGRVRKVKTNDFLVPLYEAVSNSIHSIETGALNNGKIEVLLIRDPSQKDLENVSRPLPVTGFVVSDNGVGFNEEQMASFCEADSIFKEKFGGKGVGRFSWLKFFEQAKVDSVFEDQEGRKRRSFVFSRAGVDEQSAVGTTASLMTRVELASLVSKFESKTRRSLEDVCTHLVQHFIAYLVTRSLPLITVTDGAASCNIADVYEKSIGKNCVEHDFAIKGHSFHATSIRFYLGNQSSTAFLCGHRRVSEKIPLSKRDAFFAHRFRDDNLQEYAYQTFVESSYLDSIVNDDREGFRFPEPDSLEATSFSGVTRAELLASIDDIAHKDEVSALERIKERNRETVASFVRNEAPQYRFILKKHKDAIALIHATDKAELDLALRRIQFDEETATKSELASALAKSEETSTAAKREWEEKSKELIERLNEEGKANLAAYIVQRKLILDILEKRLQTTSQGTYERERAIHELIFPMRKDSDEVGYEEQNLWVIDERLSYHYYLASDKPLRSIPVSESDSPKEPDLIIFDRPFALNDRPESEKLESIVLVEFKRPGEESADDRKNPVDQVLEYIELIQDGKAKTRSGRPMVAKNVSFFGYVLCEINPNLIRSLKRQNMTSTPDDRGMFGYFSSHNAYIEVLSYEKVLSDAKKRNRILFDKLQMPV